MKFLFPRPGLEPHALAIRFTCVTADLIHGFNTFGLWILSWNRDFKQSSGVVRIITDVNRCKHA
jgi:hypothetical protein